MPNCGIDKYDKLKSRIGLTDVDALRYGLIKSNKKIRKWEKVKRKIIEKLEKVALGKLDEVKK